MITQVKSKPPALIALADCNNFYASCERIFNPALEGKPVIVLSNNDGCVIARSNEAKALGIGMGVPVFEISGLIEQNKVHVFSSNFALYGDISNRVMNIFASFVPEIEIYSVDEAFLNLTQMAVDNPSEYCRKISATVKKWTGIPVSIGIGPTKTLAKIANHLAKKRPEYKGVMNMDDVKDKDALFKTIAVEEIWGVGRAYSKFLHKHHIHTVYDYMQAGESWIRKHTTVAGHKTFTELRGISCIGLDYSPPDKKAICTSRSFGRPLTDYNDIEQALSGFVARTAEKLRRQHSGARALMVFIMTNRFADGPKYVNSAAIQLPVSSNLTPELIKYALQCLKKLYRPGYKYKKAGVIVSDLIPEDQYQYAIWDELKRDKLSTLMKTVDKINASVGQGAVTLAVQGTQKRWKMKQERLSPAYTTRWDELLNIKV